MAVACSNLVGRVRCILQCNVLWGGRWKRERERRKEKGRRGWTCGKGEPSGWNGRIARAIPFR